MKTQLEEQLDAEGGESRARDLIKKLADMRERLSSRRTHPMTASEFAEFSVSLNAVHAAHAVLTEWLSSIAGRTGAER